MTSDHSPRTEAFLDLLSRRIAILDGAMGTSVHALALDEQGFRGEPFRDHPKDLKNCIDVLTLSQPDAIRQIHASFLEAGADIVETNFFFALGCDKDMNKFLNKKKMDGLVEKPNERDHVTL